MINVGESSTGTAAPGGASTDVDRHASGPGQQQQPRKSHRWPWVVGGVTLGLSIGVVVARHVVATREFFKAPGWGWAMVETLIQTIFRVGSHH